MSKRVVFFGLFLFLYSGKSLFSQDDPVFLTLNKNIPEKVLKTKDKSFVAVRVTFPIIKSDQRIYQGSEYGAGFTVWPDYVLTSLHLFGDYPSMWLGTKEFPTVPRVFDGQGTFITQLVFYNYTADLALLKVITPNGFDRNFSKKPAKLFKMDLNDPDSLERLASYEHFYAFAPYADIPSLFFTLELGPFRSVTNNFDEGYFLEIPMGVLQGGVQPGFSGGPLLSPKGEVVGVVARSSTIHTIVVTAETINKFLITAAAYLGLDSKGKLVVPVPPAPLSPEEK